MSTRLNRSQGFETFAAVSMESDRWHWVCVTGSAVARLKGLYPRRIQCSDHGNNTGIKRRIKHSVII